MHDEPSPPAPPLFVLFGTVSRMTTRAKRPSGQSRTNRQTLNTTSSNPSSQPSNRLKSIVRHPQQVRPHHCALAADRRRRRAFLSNCHAKAGWLKGQRARALALMRSSLASEIGTHGNRSPLDLAHSVLADRSRSRLAYALH